MARLRFLLPEPHEVPDVGRVVQPDESVEVPDGVFHSREWPASSWEVVSASRAFDPADYTVEKVLAHLAKADDVERGRVLDLERSGKARAGVLGTDETDSAGSL